MILNNIHKFWIQYQVNIKYAIWIAVGFDRKVRQRIRPKHYIVTEYWAEYYMADHCTLCGNHGWIDTRGTRTPAGKEVGRVNYCICPNGQMLRAGGAAMNIKE